ncbi:MAG TPA: cation:proton antiporter [Methylocella sp.]|nr:cation:proton antiporter [Methylocella sp.]
MEQEAIDNLIVLGFAMAGTAAVPALLPWLILPGAVLEIVLGAVIGPQILGLARPDAILGFLSDFGLGVLFLIAGFEIEPGTLRGRPIRNAAAGWGLSLAIALYAGFVLTATGRAQSALLTALALSTSAVGLLIPMLRDSKQIDTPYGAMVLAAGAVGEGTPLFILPVISAHQGGAELQAIIMAAFAASGALAIMLASHASHGAFASVMDRTMKTSGQLPMRLALCLLIFLIVVAERFEIDFVLGAFVAGAVVRAALPAREIKAMAARLDGIGSAFFVPVFFLTSGMRLDVGMLTSSPGALAMAGVYALLMLTVRGVPALALYSRDLSMRHCMALALHSSTQLALVIAIAAIAMRRGQMASDQAAALVSGAVLTVLLFPALAARVLPRPSPWPF